MRTRRSELEVRVNKLLLLFNITTAVIDRDNYDKVFRTCKLAKILNYKCFKNSQQIEDFSQACNSRKI